MAETENTSKRRRLKIVNAVNDTDETCQTFIMEDEDHTLGNGLRYIITKSDDVQFCGYSIPHPSENKLNLRIQTNGKPATDVLEDGLKNLDKMCQHILKTFESSVAEFKSSVPHDEDMS
ncbi:DNA-directed RNA polymerases I and III subunit RPAC2-like [Gigantopelta aegis]|uniref:DNA-directed RNA polymerases I and III subunit RPAC2-like n=1 Tax=Gigantopelta aegis TaxID=1735272 RepID=UPI001B889254|nr:DNA-directed RNA polymerases I and III subunit RPAC2-like [Gigantopelta aegis]